MPPRALTPEEADDLGLPSLTSGVNAAPKPLAAHEARALGLPEIQPAPAPHKSTWDKIEEAGVDGSRAGLQGLTKNYSDEALGWLASQVPKGTVGLQDDLGDLGARWGSILRGGAGGLPSDSATATTGDYETERDRYRDLNKDSKERSPIAYGVGEFAGNVASDTLLPGGYAGAALGGALSGSGASERSGLGLAMDTAGGTALGVAGKYVGDKVAGALPKFAGAARDKLEEFAERRALNAAGYGRNEVRAIVRGKDEERALDMGRHLLDEPGVIGFGANAREVQPGIDAARARWGQEMGGYLKAADAAGGVFDFSPVAKRVMDDIIRPNLKDPSTANGVRAISEHLKDYLRFYPKGSSFEQANQLKSNLTKGINWGNNWNNFGATDFAKNYQKQLVGIFKDEIDNQLGAKLGPEAQSAFQAAKSRAGSFIDATEKVKEQVGKDTVDSIGLKDLAAGGLASTGGLLTPILGPFAGVAGVAASRLARHRGASALAVGADSLAQSAPVAALADASPQALGQYLGPLGQAAGESPEALTALHWLLGQTDPEYQRRARAAAGQPPGAPP